MNTILRISGPVGVIAIAAMATAQTQFTVLKSNKPIGTSTLEIHLESSGRFIGIATMRFQNGMEVETQSAYSKDGTPISDYARLTQNGESGTVRALFGRHAVVESMDFQGDKKSKSLPYPQGAPLRDPSTFWFIRDHPKIGATVMYTSFDPSKVKFKQERCTYVGDRVFVYHGHKVTAHELQGSDHWVLMDDRTMPYEFKTSDGLLVVRR